jgi:hypothetical protein
MLRWRCTAHGEGEIASAAFGGPRLTVFISTTSRFRQNPEDIYSAAASWRLHFREF